MARVYEVLFESVLVAAPQDLLQIKGAAGKILKIKRQWAACTDTSLATAQMLSVRSRFLPATVTDGSGGSSPTPGPIDPGDAAASFTAKANSTTKATSSNPVTILEENGFHLYAGYAFPFPTPPPIGPSESFVFELLSTVSGTVHISGGVEVEEIGG